MKNKVFIDTGAFIALNDLSDQYHKTASEFFRTSAEEDSFTFLTSSLVLSESFTRILYRTYTKNALMFLDLFYKSEIKLIFSNKNIEKNAKDILKKYSDLKLSYVDAVSFQIMKDHKVKNAFTFDKHFDIYGFNRIL